MCVRLLSSQARLSHVRQYSMYVPFVDMIFIENCTCSMIQTHLWVRWCALISAMYFRITEIWKGIYRYCCPIKSKIVFSEFFFLKQTDNFTWELIVICISTSWSVCTSSRIRWNKKPSRNRIKNSVQNGMSSLFYIMTFYFIWKRGFLEMDILLYCKIIFLLV